MQGRYDAEFKGEAEGETRFVLNGIFDDDFGEGDYLLEFFLVLVPSCLIGRQTYVIPDAGCEEDGAHEICCSAFGFAPMRPLACNESFKAVVPLCEHLRETVSFSGILGLRLSLVFSGFNRFGILHALVDDVYET